MAQKILDFFKDENLNTITLAVWGLTFKPKTDDVRESPAIDIINTLINHGITIRAFDPKGIENAREILGDSVIYTDDSYSALDGADGLVIITEWNMFKIPDFDRIKSLLKRPIIFDTRNIYNPDEIRAHGFTYFGTGRP